ncbi:MAG: FAD-binding oxidoreductase [Rickettsia sp.]|nr:FAD-binding oxidoreductase [Rickettsia sp.]
MGFTDQKTAIVVGGGIMGVCTAWYFSKKKFKHVILFDSHPLPRASGSSSIDGNRAIRYSYGNDPGYTLMVADAYASWDELFADVADGNTLMTNTGTLLIKSKATQESINQNEGLQVEVPNTWIEDSISVMNKYKDKINFTGRYLTNSELKHIHPFVKTENVEYTYFTPTGGLLHAGDIVNQTVKWLKKQPNVTVYEGSEYEITNINVPKVSKNRCAEENYDSSNSTQQNQSTFCTTKSGQVFECDHMIVAAGIYINKLRPSAEDSIFYTRHVVTYYNDEDKAIMDTWKTTPLIIEYNNVNSYYLLPNIGGTGTYGIKAGDRRYNKMHYEKEDFKISDDFEEGTFQWLKQRFTDDSYKNMSRTHQKICYHDYSKENGKFIFDSLNEETTSVAIYGFSGHGFKFGALIGKVVYDSIMGKKNVDEVKEWFAGKKHCFYDDF